jgi:diguanylate cyclase (GGDEF)-like protein
MPQPILPIELVDAFGAGVYVVFGALHANLWWHRRDRPAHLWLACASGGALLVDVTGMVMRGHAAPWLLGLNMVGVGVATASLFQLVTALEGRPPGRVTRGLQVFVLGFGAMLAIPVAARLLPVQLVACMALLVAALFRAFQAGRAGDPESRTVARGLMVLLATLIFDVLLGLQLLRGPSGLPVLGFTLLFLSSGLALSARFEREHQELVALQRDLEDRVRDRTQALQDANRRLEEASRTDALTGLPNRRGFLEAADMELARIQRTWRPCTVVMADVDHFKRINDTFGHDTGDAVLVGVAQALRHALRGQDLLARWDGEAFIALMPETDAPRAVQAAEAARRALMARDVGAGPERLPVTASFGLVEHRPGVRLEATLAAAEQALARAKAEGRNRVVAAAAEPPRRA